MARIVLNTFGSLGDLHPYLALALELKRRGHTVVLATSAFYREKVEAEGLAFAPVRPDVGELANQREFVSKLWDEKHGSEYLIRDYLIPQVEAGYEDLSAACVGADLLLTHAAAYAGPIVGEALGLPWISVALQPMIFFSASDPSVVAPAPFLRHFYFLGPGFYRLLLRIADRRVRRWIGPILDLRKRLGLPPPAENPVMRGQLSPYGTIALFSQHFAPPVLGGGFVYFDRFSAKLPNEVPPALEVFLRAGKPPILFTLGSSAVMEAGSFYLESVKAVTLLGERAILLVGQQEQQQLPHPLPESIFVADYLPYSAVMPRVAAVVHQGGIGTTAQCLRAGKPMLVVPWAHDQPDNAERARKIGVARWIGRRRYRASLAARELRKLLGNPEYSEKASEVGAKVRAEDGLGAACDAVEAILKRGR